MSEPPDLHTPLSRYPWVVIRLRCHVCARHADVGLAACAARYGHRLPIEVVLRGFMSACPWDPFTKLRKPQKYGHRCGSYLPDLNSTRPPDLPPSMTGLSLIEGGRDDLLPTKPVSARRQRKIGAADDV